MKEEKLREIHEAFKGWDESAVTSVYTLYELSMHLEIDAPSYSVCNIAYGNVDDEKHVEFYIVEIGPLKFRDTERVGTVDERYERAAKNALEYFLEHPIEYFNANTEDENEHIDETRF